MKKILVGRITLLYVIFAKYSIQVSKPMEKPSVVTRLRYFPPRHFYSAIYCFTTIHNQPLWNEEKKKRWRKNSNSQSCVTKAVTKFLSQVSLEKWSRSNEEYDWEAFNVTSGELIRANEKETPTIHGETLKSILTVFAQS